jgi:hypothetical protein
VSERKVKTNNKRASAAWCEPIGELRGACAAVLEYVFVLHSAIACVESGLVGGDATGRCGRNLQLPLLFTAPPFR